ncbi:exonuclease RNase T and DNA polymerase III [Reticulomyxa filosa]|uniref:Exonuclease RNase T and DNA polymerase III n=1 Tax=Reticulomyxa filosa TaxID=46433 RepID=X6MGS3_RETFI|nr:exonuclease RNase T and DNA polymerase III [Reticulomyxa filosa]|eukprot:ETO12622.1 exonuclease RNase T and DNA polymerase III [Reticulomyxa filosa]
MTGVAQKMKKNDVRVDCEMTGLDLSKDVIVEIAVLVTDDQLNIIAEGPDLVIHHSDKVLENMSDWCKKKHGPYFRVVKSLNRIKKKQDTFGKSGLTEAIRKSTMTMKVLCCIKIKVIEEGGGGKVFSTSDKKKKKNQKKKEAETEILNFVKMYVPERCSPLCGNSIATDKFFLNKDMPTFANYLHYRMIDVSTIKELTRRWYPDIFKKVPAKKLKAFKSCNITESMFLSMNKKYVDVKISFKVCIKIIKGFIHVLKYIHYHSCTFSDLSVVRDKLLTSIHICNSIPATGEFVHFLFFQKLYLIQVEIAPRPKRNKVLKKKTKTRRYIQNLSKSHNQRKKVFIKFKISKKRTESQILNVYIVKTISSSLWMSSMNYCALIN